MKINIKNCVNGSGEAICLIASLLKAKWKLEKKSKFHLDNLMGAIS